jgi:lactonase
MENPSPLGVNTSSSLIYSDEIKGFAPIPSAELQLQTVTAEPFFQVAKDPIALEGPSYDRQGNLLFVSVYEGLVYQLTPSLELQIFYQDKKLAPAGIAIHKDGRVFIASVGDFHQGSVVAVDAQGRNPQEIVSTQSNFVPDDLVFDFDGGFYFTDFKGQSTLAHGGVYYVSPDFSTTSVVLPNMAGANGVALSPDGKVLWATEFSASRLHRVELNNATTIAHFGATVPYHFVGRAPDSMRTDADGNVYVAMYHQGRILVFSPYGIPIGQILLPGREKNQFLKSTSLAFFPGSSDLVIVSRDEVGGGGSMIFKAKGFAKGVKLFSHQT